MAQHHHLDEYYISGIKAGSDAALDSLYKKYYPMVSNFIINNSGTEQESKDVYQETIIAFYEQINAGQLQLTCSIKTYLYSISRRLWLKKLKEKVRFAGNIHEFENYIEVEGFAEDIEKKERQFESMKNALAQLGEPCKTIIEDFYIQNLSMEAITEKFGYTNADNAKNQKYKCLQRLKRFFFADNKDEI